MSLLNSMPHRCTIRLRTRTVDSTLGGTKVDATDVATNVECWAQQAGAKEIDTYEKRGIQVDRKVYFPTDPNINEQNEILITEMDGLPVDDPIVLKVRSEVAPDASAGLGVVYRIMAQKITSQDQDGEV